MCVFPCDLPPTFLWFGIYALGGGCVPAWISALCPATNYPMVVVVGCGVRPPRRDGRAGKREGVGRAPPELYSSTALGGRRRPRHRFGRAPLWLDPPPPAAGSPDPRGPHRPPQGDAVVGLLPLHTTTGAFAEHAAVEAHFLVHATPRASHVSLAAARRPPPASRALLCALTVTPQSGSLQEGVLFLGVSYFWIFPDRPGPEIGAC